MSEYEDYILQYFPDKDGKLETNKPRECRICWIRNDYPPFEELEKLCNSTLKTIYTYSTRFNWKSIRQKATDLKFKVETEAERQRQKETLKELDALNDKMRLDLEGQLDEINDKLKDPNLSDKDQYLYRQEKRAIIKELKGLQPNKLRTQNLPDKLNDRQDHKHTGELELNMRLKKYLKPENITD